MMGESTVGESTLAANLDFLDDMLAQSAPPSAAAEGQAQLHESFNENDIGSIMELVTDDANSGERDNWKQEPLLTHPTEDPSAVCGSSSHGGEGELLFTPSPPSLSSRRSTHSRVSSRKGSGSARASKTNGDSARNGSHPAVFETPELRGDDDVSPIPFFGTAIVNDGNSDDDSISQITSSIASQSFYDASSLLHTGSSRNSSGFFRKGHHAGTVTSRGESTFADTLDEIADMLHPHQQGGKSTAAPARPRSYIPPDDLYRRTSPRQSFSGVLKWFVLQSALIAGVASSLAPSLAKIRLQVRYWQSRVFPRSWKSRKSDSKDEDYYNILMNGTSPASVPHTQVTRGVTYRLRSFPTMLALLGSFCGMTILILVLRVAMMHATPRPPPASVANVVSSTAAVGKTVHGGMSVRGGMARHSVNRNVAVTDNIGLPTQESANDFSHFEHVGMDIPEAFNNVRDVSEFPVQSEADIPFYWHIPRTGGGTVNDIMGGCFSLTLASDAGGTGPAGQSDNLQTVKLSEQFSYVNVDTSNPPGLERAKRLDVVSSGLADLIVSPWLHEASELFTPQHKARLFTIFRHPVERAVSLFHYVQDTQWRRRQTFKKDLSELTIEEYFKSGLAENNWMTRFLVRELTKGELTQQDVNLAKEVIRRKSLVLLLDEKGESFSRLERYFGLQLKSDQEKECHEKKLQWAWPLKHRHDEVEEGTPLFDLIMSQNVYDMELFEYAKLLFQEQGNLFN